MASDAKEAMDLALGLTHRFDERVMHRVGMLEERTDRYQDALGTYLVKLSGKNLSLEDNRLLNTLLYTVADIERIGDHAVAVARAAKEMNEKQIRFSDQAVAELEVLERAVGDALARAVEAYATFDFDVASLTCTIWPWCYAAPEGDSPDIEDVLDGELAEGVELSVWRVDAGGAVTLIGDGIANDGTQWVRDPHPTFGTCTYRIVATDLATGAQAATDGTVETPWARVCIQWDEDWLLVVTDGVDGERPEGHRLDLPYNLRIKETSDPDVVLREYDGRDAPVAYYGTQLGIGGDWTADLRKGIDEAERAALRELMRWRDDCYVRDPYGNGYWASVQVRSLDHDYDSEAEAVSITVTRVAHEGA
jgi:hypothetical protein